jgi:hypothetical protein
MEVSAMQISQLPACGVFDEQQVQALTEAFEEALRLAEIQDRESLRAESLAERILASFKVGERDPKRIARTAAEN